MGKQIYNALFSQASLPLSPVASPQILSIFPPALPCGPFPFCRQNSVIYIPVPNVPAVSLSFF